MRRIAVFALLLMACNDPVIVEDLPFVVIEDDPPEVIDAEVNSAEPHYDEAELSRTERTFEWDPDTPNTPPSTALLVDNVRVRARRPITTAQLTEAREAGWNLEAHPESIEELRQATAEGLHRISASEVEFANEEDLYGIWEVIRNVRLEDCNNRRFGPDVRVRITQCQTDSGAIVVVGPIDTIQGASETHLSAMRRLSRFVMGVSRPPARTRIRLRWTRYVTRACDMPSGYPRTGHSLRREQQRWNQLRPNCLRHAELATQLAYEELERDVTGRVNAIAWGGRCGRSGFACDDPGACRRGLAVIPNTDTSNRFWCRTGSSWCSPWIEHDGRLFSDELCARIGIAPNRLPRRRRGRIVPLELPEEPQETAEQPAAPVEPAEENAPLAAL